VDVAVNPADANDIRWLWSRGTALDWPEVEATVVDGTVIYVGSSSTAYAPGSHHRVRHRPGDPNVVRFEVTAIKERILPIALLLMGVVFAGLGAVAGRLRAPDLQHTGAR
jgi:hypothetical protein